MVKKGIKDFLRCLKYYLVPFGILSIFLAIGLYTSITGIVSTIKTFVNDAAEIAHHVSIDWQGVWNSLLGEVMKVNFSQSLNGIVGTFFSKEWLGATLKAIASVMFGDTVTMEQIEGLVTAGVTGLIVNILILLVLIVLGFIVGIVLMKLLLRREMTQVKIGRLILFSFIDGVLWLILILIMTALGNLASWTKYFVPIMTLLILPLFCLLEGYLFYGIKRVKMKEIFDWQKILKIYIIDLAIIAITAAATALLMLIFNKVIGIYLAIPLVEIALISIGLISEKYVVELVKAKKDPAQLITQKV